MIYVIDTNSLMVLRSYFPGTFRTVWARIEDLLSEQRLVSVKEVRRELEGRDSKHVLSWAKKNSSIFLSPSPGETLFVREIFSIPHFQQMISSAQRLRGTPVADPFLVAAARRLGGCVITEEKYKRNAAKIPNICERFEVGCTDMEGMMQREGWLF